MDALTINETATRRYARTIARAVRELEAAGLADEARTLRAYATDRVEQARRQVAIERELAARPAPTTGERYDACRTHGTTAKGWRGLADDMDRTAPIHAADCRARADRLDAAGEVWGTGEPADVATTA